MGSAPAKNQLRKEFRFDGMEPVIVAGSTHRGEEEMVIKTFRKVMEKYPNARLLLAVREITRTPSVFSMVKEAGLTVLRRSQMQTEKDIVERPEVIILDTIGELGRLYSLADVVFVGGSFVKVGGHNILEPAAHGKPILVGPHMFNFRDIFEILSRRGACIMNANQKDFEKTVFQLLHDPARIKRMGIAALEVVRENQGATQRNIDFFEKLAKEYNIELMEKSHGS